MLRFISLALLASLVSGITFKDCGHGEVKSAIISACNSTPCTLHKGTTVTMNVEFIANQDSLKANFQVIVKIGELVIPIPGVDTDGCNSHVKCPIKKGDSVKLTYAITVPTMIPTTAVDITAKLAGDNGILACGTIIASITE